MRALLFSLFLFFETLAQGAECDVSMINIVERPAVFLVGTEIAQPSEVAMAVDCGEPVSDLDVSRNDEWRFKVKIPPGSVQTVFVDYLRPGPNTFSACANDCAVGYGATLSVLRPIPPAPPIAPDLAGALNAIIMLLLSE